jgi:hypothetical protein
MLLSLKSPSTAEFLTQINSKVHIYQISFIRNYLPLSSHWQHRHVFCPFSNTTTSIRKERSNSTKTNRLLYQSPPSRIRRTRSFPTLHIPRQRNARHKAYLIDRRDETATLNSEKCSVSAESNGNSAPYYNISASRRYF